MPLTQKGQEILRRMEQEYGPEKGKSVFYASRNAGTISGVDSAAGALLLAPSGRALFMRRSDKASDHQGEWCCPGGSIEAGETPEQAAHRETQEETGYPLGDLTRIDDDDGYVTFRSNVDAEFLPKLNEEHIEYRWASLDAPPEPTHPGVLGMLKRLLGRAIEAGKRESTAEKASETAGAEEAEAQRQAKALLTAQDKREWDDNGWFEVLDNPLSKVGVYPYSEASVIKGGDPKKMVGVYRPAEELGSEECVKSFRLMPWTDDHPSALLGDESQGLVPAEKKGVHGVIGEKTYFKDGTLYGNVKVFSEALARKISSGKRELSCGYHCDFIPQTGVFAGQPYQYVQRNMRGNHVASVKAGRMGSGVRVLDAAEPHVLSFALDLKEPIVAKREDEMKDCVDSETQKFIGDSFNSLVGELEKKGYSKEYATKIAGKVAAEKGMTGHHDSKDSTGAKIMAADADTKGDVKDPEGKKDDPSKKDDLKSGEAKDRKAARDAKRGARDARRAKDSLSEEEEEAEDAAESAEDAEEEKEDEKDESKEARDRRSARDRRGGARDWRKFVRDKRHAKDTDFIDTGYGPQPIRGSKGYSGKKAGDSKGMDAAEIAALVNSEVDKRVAAMGPAMRKEEAAKAALYGRLSPLVGAFDHAEMTHADMAAYGLKKLGAPEAKDKDPVMALDYFLAGRTQIAEPRRAAQDGSGESYLDKYLAA